MRSKRYINFQTFLYLGGRCKNNHMRSRFMKTKSMLFTIVLSAMVIQHGYSQTNKGSFLVGFTLSAKPPETNRYEFTVSPDVSYFVVDRLAVGLVAPVNYIHEDRPDRAYVRRITTFAIGPVVRYYFSFGSWAI